MRHRTKQAWLALFEQQRTRGLTSKAFCEQQPLNPNYFSKRRGELESPSGPLLYAIFAGVKNGPHGISADFDSKDS